MFKNNRENCIRRVRKLTKVAQHACVCLMLACLGWCLCHVLERWPHADDITIIFHFCGKWVKMPRRHKAKNYIDLFFQIALRTSSFFWPIIVIENKTKQTLAKMTLETKWEAYFEPNSYGFRLGRNCQDAAIKAIFLTIRAKLKYVLNADISKCFNCINHEALLNKQKTRPNLVKQVKGPKEY